MTHKHDTMLADASQQALDARERADQAWAAARQAQAAAEASETGAGWVAHRTAARDAAAWGAAELRTAEAWEAAVWVLAQVGEKAREAQKVQAKVVVMALAEGRAP